MVATALTIGFLESGTVQLSGPFLYGDENGVSLILKKDDDTFVIQPGEKIIINDEIYTYKSVDVASQTLLMENISIPLDDVSAIHYVLGTKMKERVLKVQLVAKLARFIEIAQELELRAAIGKWLQLDVIALAFADL